MLKPIDVNSRDVDLINVYHELSKSDSPGLKRLVDSLRYYGTIELNQYVRIETLRAVFVGLLSTSNDKLKLEDIKLEAVEEFRDYLTRNP